MYLVTLFCVFILGLCTSTPTGNLTAVALEPLKILCPEARLQIVERAISNHVQNTLLAFEKAQLGTAFPPFYALYKSEEHKGYIVALFDRMARLGPIGFPWYRRRPTFVCIRSEDDALPYQSTIPTLWEQCIEDRPSPPQTIDPIASYETKTLFLCRPFFRLSDDRVGPTPEQCPGVHENMFTDEPVHAAFANRATYITTFAVNAYSDLPNAGRAMSYIELLNSALGWDANIAPLQPWTYLFFERLTKNACTDIPDINEPPWNHPGSLSLNATGNVTSNATENIRSNTTANNIIPQNESQLSTSPASLPQVLPANFVNTS